jgi:hypothetical protein
MQSGRKKSPFTAKRFDDRSPITIVGDIAASTPGHQDFGPSFIVLFENKNLATFLGCGATSP